MPSVDWNRQVWGQDHTWPEGGDEWNDLASQCGEPYTEWKDALIETFIAPHAVDADVLEIAPGYGRWTELLAKSARRVVLVDINENCLSACQKRFEHLTQNSRTSSGRSRPRWARAISSTSTSPGRSATRTSPRWSRANLDTDCIVDGTRSTVADVRA
jgi:hypothetical protein